MNLDEAAKHLKARERGYLTRRLALLEPTLKGRAATSAVAISEQNGFTDDALRAALVLKAAAGQINVLIHAVGILTALPHILKDDERVESLSLGAGNTGRCFDLETNLRIAEFHSLEIHRSESATDGASD